MYYIWACRRCEANGRAKLPEIAILSQVCELHLCFLVINNKHHCVLVRVEKKTPMKKKWTFYKMLFVY